MSRDLFIETVRAESKHLANIQWHQWRVNWTQERFFPKTKGIDLAYELSKIERDLPDGCSKIRVIYGECVEKIEISPYIIAPCHTLQPVESGIRYPFKSVERDEINALYAKRGDASNIIILHSGYLTDTAYTNVALLSDDGSWHTPKNPLLRGTERERLLFEKRLIEKEIHIDEISRYSLIRMFNAMIPFDIEHEIPVECIRRSIIF